VLNFHNYCGVVGGSGAELVLVVVAGDHSGTVAGQLVSRSSGADRGVNRRRDSQSGVAGVGDDDTLVRESDPVLGGQPA
jgi:hypothetical protein